LNTLRIKSVIVLLLLSASLLIYGSIDEKITASALPFQNPTQPLQVTSVEGVNVTLAINGNVSVSQITDLFFENLPNWYNNTNINFNLRGLNGSSAFLNMTIPKSAILGGTVPVETTNGMMPTSYGFTQDAENFYVWFTTHPLWDDNNVSLVTIQFLLASSNHKLLSTCTQTLTVPALGTQDVSVMVNKGEILSGSIFTSSSQGKDIAFRVTDPNGNTVIRFDHVTSKDWRFVTSTIGTYTMTVDNSASSSKIVTLSSAVSINSSSRGVLDSLLFVGFIALIITVVVVVVVVLLITRHMSQISHQSQQDKQVLSTPKK
jgi:hypothetical protein